jgi:mono/diheme cytochrome c family protein
MPTKRDVALSIREGMPGTSMHGFGGVLSEAEIMALVDRVLEFDHDNHAADPARALVLPEPPAASAPLVARGETLYGELGCAQCHGTEGRGDGPSAAALRDSAGRPSVVWDLTAAPLRRPRPEDEPALVSIYRTLATGLGGTPMPAYAEAAADDDLWAVAAYIDAIRYRGRTGFLSATTVSETARTRDREGRVVESARWPGGGVVGDEIPFGGALELQGEPPPSLAPAQASLSAQQCARCHKKQVREWRGSMHAFAGSPGLVAQLLAMERDGNYREVESCQRCHNPLAEAQPALRAAHWGGDPNDRAYTPNPRFDAELRDEGVNCATCHVRGWRRHGPASREGSGLRDAPGYPRDQLAIYGRADFCLPCHQQTPRNSRISGRPLLNTYREWLEGPYMPRGIQCQHCHMPNREHTFKGVHDEDTFRQAIDLEVIAGRSARTGAVSVRARLWNIGAGHFLPTTPTPAVWLDIRLVDDAGAPIEGATATLRIGRHLVTGGGMREAEDTRIPPGEYAELAAAWTRGRVPEASHAEIAVRVEPDEFYERFYRARLRRELPDDERAMFEEALRLTEESKFTALRRRVPIR